ITNPYVILLDEPTTGLDSVNALRVAQLLQDLARDDKRTVLCTIHSPSSELFALFDDLLLLGKGHVIYHGPTADAVKYFASIGYPVPPRTNPSEYYMNLLQLPPAELQGLWESWEAYLVSTAADGNLSVRPLEGTIRSADANLDRRVGEKGSPFSVQMTMLTARSWRQFVRDPGALVGRTVQTIFFALLLGLFFFGVDNTREGVQDRAGALFLIMLNNFFLAAISGIASFPPERAVFLMEQSSENYSAWAYSLAKNISELPFQIGFPIIFTSTMYFMIGFAETPKAFFKMLLLIIMIGNQGYSFGIFMASLFPTPQISMAALPVVMLPLALVSGLFANSDRLEPAWYWLEYISFPRYAYTGLFLSEFSALDTICDVADTTCSFKTGQDVIHYYGFTRVSWGTCIYALVIYLMGLKVISATLLWHQGRARRGNLSFHKNLDSREMSPRAAALSGRNASPQHDA
ncbi:ABC transporter, putative, partial [Bodo saltans]